jgi:hypothetical protein
MTRQGAAIALRGGADGDDHCRTGSDLCPLRQHPDAGDAVRPPHLEPLDRTIERLGPATEHDLVMIVAIPERMLAGQGRRRSAYVGSAELALSTSRAIDSESVGRTNIISPGRIGTS